MDLADILLKLQQIWTSLQAQEWENSLRTRLDKRFGVCCLEVEWECLELTFSSHRICVLAKSEHEISATGPGHQGALFCKIR